MLTIALVGAPRTGKSTLFSVLLDKKIRRRPDVDRFTRDRHYSVMEWRGKNYILIDTGGIVISDEEMDNMVLSQTSLAIEDADLVFFLVDCVRGVHPLDKGIARLLHKKNKETVLLVNKVDHPSHEARIWEFASLGFKKMIFLSALHKRNIYEILEYIEERDKNREGEKKSVIKELPVLILGRPNAGKSTLFNALLGEERAIVHSAPGTTREPVEAVFNYGGYRILIRDTAGVPRRIYGRELGHFNWRLVRGEGPRARLALLVIDLTEGITRQDRKLAQLIEEFHLGHMIVGNKNDLKKINPDDFRKMVKMDLPFLADPPLCLVSALRQEGTADIFNEL